MTPMPVCSPGWPRPCRTACASATGATCRRSSPRSPPSLARRQESKTDGPEIFLFIHDLPRFRDLRRKEDDFSFSRKDEDAGPADQLDADPPRRVRSWACTSSLGATR